MLIPAIAAGLFVFLITAPLVGELVTHKWYEGIIPGLVAGIWAAWPIMYQGKVDRYSIYHPMPKRYKMPVKQAFKIIREQLDEDVHNFGDSWKVQIADTQAKKIRATMKWTDEETQMAPGGGGQMGSRKGRVQRLLEMHVKIIEEPNDSTVVKFDFYPRVEGWNGAACEGKVKWLLLKMEGTLGGGTDVSNQLVKTLPAPPDWLLGLTALVLLLLLSDVVSAVFH